MLKCLAVHAVDASKRVDHLWGKSKCSSKNTL